MVCKSLAASSNKIKILYFLFSLCSFLFLLHVILNNEETNKSYFIDLSQFEKEYRKRYNLMEELVEVGGECNLDYMNERKLPQDHPCVIKLIRDMFLNSPSPRDVPYKLTDSIPANLTSGTLTSLSPPVYHPGKRNGSDMEAFLLKNQKGFFVECGAYDGVSLSNTLNLEMDHNWTGLLIEASPENFHKLMTRNRKAWSSNVCLSLMPYPTRISFTAWDSKVKGTEALYHVIETDEEEKNIINDKSDTTHFGITNRRAIKIQCFPFYSLLLAINQTTINYFSLDIEGHEKRVLETIPWKKMDIKMMRIETMHIPADKNNKTGSDALKDFLEGEPGYIKFHIDRADDIYMKNNINKV